MFQRRWEGPRLNDAGLTLVEVILAAAALSILVLAFSQFIFPMLRFVQRNDVRSQLNLDMRSTTETIQQWTANGRGGTLQVTSPVTANSQVTFEMLDGSTTTITWSKNSMNSVHLQRTPVGGPLSDVVLSQHVSELAFSFDPQDPALLTMRAVFTYPLDQSGKTDSMVSVPITSVFQMLNMSS